ncbi:immunity 8 family protein [Mesorhizobium sp. B2-1-8]|uniref:Imm8 family immunity protein n=1 Tax=Mesorhizobium sp. B2-1-8 TaxID=2589967 RepID=UPI00112AFF41|nr:Imm8 family immunity protein [Mesorhizobium sp. B2-1-8]UCI22012.1 immunity 8 family protein [Mesorhizobium sp. B2-1-8]
MRAQYKGHRVVETKAGTFALDTWKPRDPTDFSVIIDFYAGPEGDTSADAFTVTVCSPNRFLRSQSGNVFSGESVIFMIRFDYDELEKFLTDRCTATEGDTWDAIGAQLTRLGRWEFDYRLQISN